MQIKRHDRSHLVELRDGSAWRIWPGDIPKTLQWRPTTEIDVADIDDEICSHALIDRSNGSRVRVISFTAQWPAAAVRRCLRHGRAACLPSGSSRCGSALPRVASPKTYSSRRLLIMKQQWMSHARTTQSRTGECATMSRASSLTNSARDNSRLLPSRMSLVA